MDPFGVHPPTYTNLVLIMIIGFGGEVNDSASRSFKLTVDWSLLVSSAAFELCIVPVLVMSAPSALKPFNPVCVAVKLHTHTYFAVCYSLIW